MKTCPHMTVTLDDGTVHDVQTDNRDLIRFDMLRAAQGWPKITDAPSLWATVLAWSALARAGVLASEGVAGQLERIRGCEPVDDGDDDVDPTQPTA